MAWPLFAVLIVQLLLEGHVFPWQELLTGTPILNIDHPFHLYQIAAGSAFADQGALTGYDPFFAAGYVGGVTFNASAHAPTLLAWLFGGALGQVQVYKLYIFGVAVLAPFALTGAAALGRLKPIQVWYCAPFSIALWWATGTHWLYTAGLVSFVAASFFALPYCVLLHRLMDASRVTALVLLLGVTGAMLFMVHPFFVIPPVFFCVARLLTVRPVTRWPRLSLWLVVVGIISLLPNLPWLLAMRADAAAGIPPQFSVPYQMLVDSRLIWEELLGITNGPVKGGKINPLLFVLAAISLWRLDRSLRPLVVSMIATWAALAAFAAFGAALPFIGAVQPNRFSSTAYLFLVIPAAVGLDTLVTAIRLQSKPVRFAALAGAGVLGLVGLAVANEVRREATYGPWGRYGGDPPEVRGLGPKGTAVLAWLRTETRPDGRVLFETSLGRIHDGGHIVGYLALQSGREFIGGPYNNLFAGTRDGWMFGRPLESIAPAEFLAYLRQYNVGWIVVHSAVAKRYLAAFSSGIEKGPEFEGLQTFNVRQPLDFVEDGRGAMVSAGYGKLVVERRGTSTEPIVLRYHYLQGMRARDGSKVEPVFRLDDPTPFIQVTPLGKTVELVR